MDEAIVEVFKTNVEQREDADKIIHELQVSFANAKINFDLEDCDRILRVEGDSICNEEIIAILNKLGFEASVLN